MVGMALLPLVVAAALLQNPLEGGKIVVNAYMPGQREIVMGAAVYPTTLMQVLISRDMEPDFPAGGGDVAPGGLMEKTIGFVQFAGKEDTFGGKPCIHLSYKGTLTEKLDKRFSITVDQVRDYWVGEDGKILRLYDIKRTPFRTNSASCVFHEDSVDITADDEKGRRTTTIYPNVSLSELDAQFKPMMKDGEIILRDKDFYTLDPYTGICDKVSVHVAGSVGGEVFHQKLSGKTFEIASPLLTQTAAISSAGDLLEVQLPHQRVIKLSNPPPTKSK